MLNTITNPEKFYDLKFSIYFHINIFVISESGFGIIFLSLPERPKALKSITANSSQSTNHNKKPQKPELTMIRIMVPDDQAQDLCCVPTSLLRIPGYSATHSNNILPLIPGYSAAF
ncbi:MAG: hypothetical protein COA78_37175 [Blastopirellula sp.]|nr:MAG: hypothetical protein COA78_37175 [Blastopirellula sp.]